MKKCCYCESSSGYLTVIQNHYWHKECLIFRSRYIDYFQENLNLQKSDNKIAHRKRQKQVDQNIKNFLNQYGHFKRLNPSHKSKIQA